MTIALQKQPDFYNLANTGTASLDIEPGMTFHNLLFSFAGSGALTRDMIKEVRVLINGKAFIRAPANILHRDNMYKGSFDDANIFLLDFEEPRSKTVADQIATAIHTFKGVQTFKVEFDIVGATSPKITTHAHTSASEIPLGALPCFYRETYDAVSTGVKQIKYGYDKSNGHLLRRVHFVPSVLGVEQLPVDHINHVSLLKNGLRVIDQLTPQTNVFYQKHYEGIPQTNIMTMDFVEDNNTTLNLMPTSDGWLMWELDVKAVAHFDIYYSVISALENI